MTITSFAKLVETNRTYIQHWMAGQKPSQHMLNRVRKITNGDVFEFIDLINEHPSGKK
jgi:hypothetical protein